LDIQVRRRDADIEAMKLHSDHGVEMVTIYAGAAPDSKAYGMERPHPLLEYTAEQYARLATLRAWAWTAATFQGDSAAQSLLTAPPILGRQSSFGFLLEAEGEK
jgi:hypothetical protein